MSEFDRFEDALELSSEDISPQDILQDEALPEVDPAPAILAELLYDRTASNKVASQLWLRRNKPERLSDDSLTQLLQSIREGVQEGPLSSAAFIQGSKDVYYYDASIMTPQFAKLDALIEDKDILKTIADVTRSDCELYPRPTEFAKMMDYPFHFTIDEVEGAAARMSMSDQYSDIGVVQASNGAKAFYSDRFIKKGYAQSLLEYSEVESHLWP